LGWRRRLRGAPGRGTLEKDKPPILGLIQRGGQVVLCMLPNVQQTTIKPVIAASVAPGTVIRTDEYDIYARLPAWCYEHKTVCLARCEYARDEDGDGFCEIHVNMIETSGRCCAPGCACTAASRRRNCLCISVSSSSCTTPVAAVRLCSALSSAAWSDEASPHHPGA
jgi:hypothetical protein